jgi:hypothetical protein
MRSANFVTAPSITFSGNTPNISFSYYQPFNFSTNNSIDTRNSPTKFEIWRQRFTNCPWELVGQIPYNVNQTNYTQTLDVGTNTMLYNYKITVNNASGESTYPYLLTHHNNSGMCPSIIGPTTICVTADYTLSQQALTMWSIEPAEAFAIESDFHSATITALIPGATGMLTAKTGAGATFVKIVKACVIDIIGEELICTEGNYTLSEPTAHATYCDGEIIVVPGDPIILLGRIFPNPTSDELTIEFEINTVAQAYSTNESTDVSIILIDNMGIVQRQSRFNHRHQDGKPKPIKFNVSNLREGTYFLHIKRNGEIEKEQIIINRK